MEVNRERTPSNDTAVVFPRQRNYAELSDKENDEEYEPGGYLRVSVADTFKQGQYHVLKKIGWGHFSTVWLCLDQLNQRTCALKIQKSSPHYADAAHDEIRILRELGELDSSGSANIIAMYDSFEHDGHVCLVFEVLGKSLLRLIQRFNYNGVPLPLVKVIVRQLLEGLAFIHEAGCIHTDLKPENVLFVPPDMELQALANGCAKMVDRLGALQGKRLASGDCEEAGREYARDIERTFADATVKIVDFGNACWLALRLTCSIQTRQYRSPEAVIESAYDSKVDMWSLACLTFELITGEYLFNPKRDDDAERDEKHIALMMELLGPVPISLIRQGKCSGRIFKEGSNELKNETKVQAWDMRHFLEIQCNIESNDAVEITEFLMSMLSYEPQNRLSARDALKHPFVSRIEKKQSFSVASPANVIPKERGSTRDESQSSYKSSESEH